MLIKSMLFVISQQTDIVSFSYLFRFSYSPLGISWSHLSFCKKNLFITRHSSLHIFSFSQSSVKIHPLSRSQCTKRQSRIGFFSGLCSSNCQSLTLSLKYCVQSSDCKNLTLSLKYCVQSSDCKNLTLFLKLCVQSTDCQSLTLSLNCKSNPQTARARHFP